MHDGKQEVMAAFSEAWEDVAYNGDLNVAEKAMMICEFPFTVLRKVRIRNFLVDAMSKSKGDANTSCLGHCPHPLRWILQSRIGCTVRCFVPPLVRILYLGRTRNQSGIKATFRVLSDLLGTCFGGCPCSREVRAQRRRHNVDGGGHSNCIGRFFHCCNVDRLCCRSPC